MLCRQAENGEIRISWGQGGEMGQAHALLHMAYSQQELGQEAVANQPRASGSVLVTGWDGNTRPLCQLDEDAAQASS